MIDPEDVNQLTTFLCFRAGTDPFAVYELISDTPTVLLKPEAQKLNLNGRFWIGALASVNIYEDWTIDDD